MSIMLICARVQGGYGFRMPDPNDKNPRNVVGAYYNDMSCTDCDLCRVIAPTIFVRDDEEALTYVARQPRTEAEVELAEEALNGCPTETIGRDGEG